MKLRSSLALTAALTAFPLPAHAQRDLTQIPDTNPDAQIASFQLPPGLEINLFAAEPLVKKPIQMAWDAQGRLWVASSAIYPQVKPGQDSTDQILILEDTNRDGKVDKSTVFQDGLIIPTGIWPQDGGAYVANSTELLFLKDTDGDGKADQRTTLLTGFGTEDTHHILHTIRPAPNGALFMAQSVYIHSHIETPFGPRRLGGSGFWEFQPETGRLEVFNLGQVNPWGLIFDPWGRSFTTDGAYGEGINHTFPGATFRCLPNQLPRILTGLNPGQPKQCGLERISGAHFPDDWQGQLITADFRGHRVNRFETTESGSGFTSKQLDDIVRSNHGSFRPIDMRMGPDGALYIADWYNPIIQHGEVDFRDPRRDKAHGRIWRVTVKDRPLCPPIDYPKLTETQLLDLLKASEDWVRHWAKQELKSRKISDLTKKLAAWLEANDDPRLVAEAAWTAETCGLADFSWFFTTQYISNRPDRNEPRLRAAGLRLLSHLVRDKGLNAFTDSEGKPMPIETVEKSWAGFADDESPIVRLEALSLFRQARTAKAAEAASRILNHPVDTNLDFAAWLTLRELAPVWLPAFKNGDITFDADPKRITFALQAAEKPEAVAILIDLVRDGKLPASGEPEALRLVGTLGKQPEIDALFALARDPAVTPTRKAAALDALATAAAQQNLIPANPGDTLTPLLTAPETSAAAATLAGLWKIEATRPALEALAKSNESNARPASRAALQALVRLGGDPTRALLTSLADQNPDAVAAFITLDPAAAAAPAANLLASLTESGETDSVIFDAALQRQDAPNALATALANKKLAREVATNGIRKASTTGADTKALTEALTKAGNLQPVTTLTGAQMAAMIQEVAATGNPARGEEIYRRTSLQCVACHAIAGTGGVVGPDLISIGSSAPADYIIDSLLEPGKKIKEGYATVMITTKDGTVKSGFLMREDEREVQLRDTAGTIESIPASQVANKQVIPVSLMPAGLTHSLRRDEFIDLARFLTELGKPGPFESREDGTLRDWKIATNGGNTAESFAQNPAATTWIPFTAKVNGTLPLTEITPVNNLRILQTEITIPASGTLNLQIESQEGLRLFLGTKEIQAAPTTQLTTTPGKHLLTLASPHTLTTTPKLRLTTP
jgi:putative heme-binding domain-containing protein